MQQIRENSRERQRQLLRSLDNFSLIDLTGPDSVKQNTVLTPPHLMLPHEMRATISRETGAIPKQPKATTVTGNNNHTLTGAVTNTVYTNTATTPTVSYEFPKTIQSDTITVTPKRVNDPVSRSPIHGQIGSYSQAILDEIERRRKQRGDNDHRTVRFRKIVHSYPQVRASKDTQGKAYRSTVYEQLPHPSQTHRPAMEMLIHRQ